MSNEEQFEFWNGEAGQHWAQDDATMARMLRPISAALLAHARVGDCQSALDVGCGGGSQSLMLAEQLGGGARVLGIDISQPLVEVARKKCDPANSAIANMEFLQADAAEYAFAPNSFDLLFSRFGVMFFDDPERAFSNLRQSLRPGAHLAFCCWQAMPENEWMLLPMQAALQHLPPPPQPDPNAPGPFAFANPERVKQILGNSGFADVELESFRTHVNFAEAATLGESVRDMATLGPLGKLMAGQEQEVLERVFDSMEERLAPYFKNGALSMQGAIWLVTASSP